MATYSLVIRRLMVCSLTIVMSRAMTSAVLTLFLSTKLGLDQQDIVLLVGVAVFLATLLGLYGGYIIDRLEKRRLLNLAILSSGVVFTLLTFAQNVYLTTLTLVITETASAQALKILSAVLACNAITVILIQYEIGRFLKREQLPYCVCLGSALFVIGLVGFSLAQSTVAWWVAMFVFTRGEMIIYPAEYLFVDTLAPDHLRGSYLGAQNLAASGGAMSPVICGYLLINTPTPTMFYVLAGLTAMGRTLCFLSGRRVNTIAGP
ncbi:MFS transporter [Pseudomonas huanghezhanensis]|uniref:MFS transporter n=1 Tax=Pseudomonas huanghezhanensis TaxID=3002903 RepID=UPI002286911B|nr:MFS transporter [Pseudomonas sp. BSw22131]